MGFLTVGENGEGTAVGRISGAKVGETVVYDRGEFTKLFRGYDDQGTFSTPTQYALQLGGKDPHAAGGPS